MENIYIDDVNDVDDVNDWENTEIPDLTINIEEFTKNKERELKILEQRKMMEESDLILAEELFCENKNKLTKEPIIYYKPQVINKKTKIDKILIAKKIQELEEKQRKASKINKEKKQNDKRLAEIYGEAEPDECYEKYGYLIDKF